METVPNISVTPGGHRVEDSDSEESGGSEYESDEESGANYLPPSQAGTTTPTREDLDVKTHKNKQHLSHIVSDQVERCTRKNVKKWRCFENQRRTVRHSSASLWSGKLRGATPTF